VSKWFALQATSDIPGNVVNVKKLLAHPAFDMRNPNKVPHSVICNLYHFVLFLCESLTNGILEIQVYSLIGGFCGSAVNFHAKDGSGYKFLGEVVLQLDKINPQVSLKS
jgi:aminopeptidase N